MLKESREREKLGPLWMRVRRGTGIDVMESAKHVLARLEYCHVLVNRRWAWGFHICPSSLEGVRLVLLWKKKVQKAIPQMR